VNPFSCPHNRVVVRERGDFIREHGVEKWVVKKQWEETLPCGETKYVVTDEHPFNGDSGFDFEAILVRCVRCGQESYVIPKIKRWRQVSNKRGCKC